MNKVDFQKDIALTGRKIENLLSQAEKPLTAWDLKMTLKVSHTLLHLTLGVLLERKRITLRPDSLTYIVEGVPVQSQTDVSTNGPKEPVGASSEKLG